MKISVKIAKREAERLVGDAIRNELFPGRPHSLRIEEVAWDRYSAEITIEFSDELERPDVTE